MRCSRAVARSLFPAYPLRARERLSLPVPGAVYIGGPLSLDAMFDRLTNESGAMFFSGANLSVCDLLVKRGPLKEFSIIMNNVHYTWKGREGTVALL